MALTTSQWDPVDPVFFSTFKIQSHGVERHQKFYDPSLTPILYVGHISNVLGCMALCALDAIVHPLQFYTDHPTPAQSIPAQRIPTLLRRCFLVSFYWSGWKERKV
jgi:hypothetical protein